MDKERLPIKFFAPREVDELRVEGGRSPEEPQWILSDEELVQKATQLKTELTGFTEIIKEKESRQSPVPFTFIAKLSKDATAKSRRGDIAALFQETGKDSIIGLAESDELIVAVESYEQIKKISDRLGNYSKSKYAISCLENFVEFYPKETFDGESKTYKIKLIDFQDYEFNITMQRLFERELRQENIAFNKTYYASNLPIYKLENISLDSFTELKDKINFEMLFSIEPMPKYTVSLDTLQQENSIKIKEPEDNQSYKTLGILDNGISAIPHIKPWLVGDRWTVYPESYIEASHGTFVAGVALYGDECDEANWVGNKGIKIFDAAVFPDERKEGIDEDELIANIQEAIAANYEKVKIWNVSLSITRQICDSKFSDFAIALDDIQNKYNVLICKSAGNCKGFLNDLPKGRLHEGADSIRSLVVGSVAHKKSKYDIAEVDNPSPFSRVGPGPEFVIKPEVSHYGGNAGVDGNGNLTTTGVRSFSSKGDIVTSVGTSFSTPRVAALATGLYQELDENFDPLLLKALIVHSATYPENLKTPIAERTKQMGFGVPKTVREIIYDKPYETTLILRDTLVKGEYIDIMDFPMPKSLIRNGYYTGQIIVTLVYDPILDASQGVEYCQSNVDVKFGSYDIKEERDIEKRNILNPVGRKGAKNLLIESLYSRRIIKERKGEFALKERLLIQYGDKYYPVKKYAVDLSELTEANRINYASADKEWYLYLRGLYRNHIEQVSQMESFTPKQDVCLIITIRDPEEKANAYDEMTQNLDELNFWHTNIKVSNDISIEI